MSNFSAVRYTERMSEIEKTLPRFFVEEKTSETLVIEKSYLLVLNGKQAGTVFTVDAHSHTMGRGTSADFQLHDEQASREHLAFRIENGLTVVEDLKSTNGSFVNAKKVQKPLALTDGDEIQIGGTKLKFSVLNPIDGTRLGILNHGYFEMRMIEELDRSVRYKRPTSIVALRILFDPNHAFDVSEQANTYSALVNYTRKVIRNMDVMAHYGKHDLEIMLPETSIDEAEKLAVRITKNHKLGPRIFLKAGLASYPDHGSSKDMLLEKARDALKEAEVQGKDVVQAKRISGQIAKKNTANKTVVASPKMKEVFELAERVAQSTITVLILGETGVGKEVVADVIHQKSKRSTKPLVCVNCAALTETLLESELFGHEKGSFTGADHTKIGLFETADGGTIFLDEVGEMPQKTQAKLLRVLQSKKIMRVGSNKEINTEVRVVAATNRDLESQVKNGTFREDLFYRLNAATIFIPPLRERQEEIEELVNFFIQKFCDENDFAMKQLGSDALKVLQRYPWPGNIRELKNTVERAVIISEGDTIDVQSLGTKMSLASISQSSFNASQNNNDDSAHLDETQLGDMKEVVGSYERKLILRALEETGWNQTKAAEILNVPRRTLVSKIKKYDIKR